MRNTCEIRIYDGGFNWIGVIQNAESVQFRREFYGTGDFEIHLRPDKKYADLLLKRNNFIIINGDSRKIGFVRDFYLEESRSGAELVIFGDTAEGLVKQRTVIPPTEKEAPQSFGWDRIMANAETVLKHYMRRNLTEATAPVRNIPRLVIAPDEKRGIYMPWQARYTPLNEVLLNIAEYADMGWYFYYDHDEKIIIADIDEGTDRTVGQMDISPVLFQMEYTNMGSYKYTENFQTHRTTGILGGAGEDEKRLIYTLGGEYEGINRWETFIDCGGAEDLNELIYYGQQKLNGYAPAKTIEADALPKIYIFERDFFLGDKVSVTVSRLNLDFDSRITSVNEIWERNSGYRYEIRFGDQIPNLYTVLKTTQEVR